MKIDSINRHNLEVERTLKANVEYKRQEDYRKLIDKRSLDKIIAERIQRNKFEVVVGSEQVYVKGDVTIFVDGNVKMTVGGNYQADIGGTCKITSGGNMTLKAPKIDLNP